MKFMFGLTFFIAISTANAQDLKKTFRIDFNTFNPQSSDDNKCIHSSAGPGGVYSGFPVITLTIYKDKKTIFLSQKKDEKLTTFSFRQNSEGFQLVEFGPCQDQIESAESKLLGGGIQLKVNCKTSPDQLILETNEQGHLTRVSLNLNEQKPIEGLFRNQSGITFHSSCASLNH